MIRSGLPARAARALVTGALAAVAILATSGHAQNGQLGTVVPAPQQQQPDFTLDTPLITIAPGQSVTEQDVPLRYSGERPAAPPFVEDSEKAAGPVKVSFTVDEWMRFDMGAGWLMRAKVDGADKIVSPQLRILMIRLGDKLYRKTYKLQPADLGTVILTVAPPMAEVPWPASSWPLEPASPPLVPLQVTAGNAPAHNVRIVSSGVQDKDSPNKNMVSDPFVLCADPDCKLPVSEIGAGTTQLWLKAPAATPPAGVYEGTFALAADGLASPQSFNLKFDVTSPLAKLGGTLLLVVGTALGLLLSYGLNVRSDMLNAGRPTALLLARVTAVQLKLAHLGKQHPDLDWPRLRRGLEAIAGELGAARLANFGIGSGPRALLKAVSTPIDTAGLATHVAAQGKAAARLEVLATRGIAVAAAEVAPEAEAPAAIVEMVKELDALADRPDIADGGQMLAAIVPILAKKDGDEAVLTGARVQVGARPIPWTVDWIDLESARVGASWLMISALLTVAVGWYLLIASNAGFGRPQDYLLCLFWGLGFTTGAGTLPTLDAGKIRTQIALPRPG